MNTVTIVVALLFFACTHTAMGQTDDYSFQERKDAAVAELKNYPRADTARVRALIKVFITAAFLKERKEVTPYRLEAMAISKRLNYKYGIAQYYISTGHYYKSASDPVHALIYYDSALALTASDSTMYNRDFLRAVAFERKGTIFFEQENYYPALDYLFEALKFTDSASANRQHRIYITITEIYTLLNNLEKATEYAVKNIELTEKDSSLTKRAGAYFAFIDVCLEKKDYQMAALCLDKIKPIIPHPKEIQINFGYYLKMGHLAYQQQQYDKALANYQQCYQFAVMGGHKGSIGAALQGLSGTALKLGNDEAAKTYAEQDLALAFQTNTKQRKIEALLNLSAYFNKKGNTKKAYDLLQQATQIKDSLLSENNLKQIHILSAIYETDKQQKEINRLQDEKEKQQEEVRHKSTLNTIFIASIMALLFVGYLGYINFKKGQLIAGQQQALQHQKIIELEKNKQLVTIDAMLKGQEEERSRIAKDLHDGLGSSLSGTKLSFVNVRESLPLNPEVARQFDRSLSMLDNTIGDLRKVAQNLMPEALVKFGLHEALRDFCDGIQSTSGIKVLYQQFGEKRKLGNTAEVFTYRIIQELVANVIKHAEATEVIVQLTMSNHKTGITVEDNGKGFDKSILQHTKSAGMSNINYRVEYFNGCIDIVTSPGNGTSVNIDLMV